jgi:membrane protease YdiL (CAAX protease family)
MKDDPGTVRGPDWWLALNVAWWRLTIGPEYPPHEADQRDVTLFGLALPSRATVAVFAVTAIILLDQARVLVPLVSDGGLAGLAPISMQRFVLFLVAPLVIVVVVFRDDPRRYALALGNWRWGLGLLLAGLAIMTPIILGLSTLPQFRGFYGDTTEPLGGLVLNHLVELLPAEFLLRGFLMFALWRRIGPLALVVVQVPFVLTHIGKPDVELWSTFIGGSIFAWLDWRTGSILWSALGHLYVLTLMEVAVGGATVGT